MHLFVCFILKNSENFTIFSVECFHFWWQSHLVLFGRLRLLPRESEEAEEVKTEGCWLTSKQDVVLFNSFLWRLSVSLVAAWTLVSFPSLDLSGLQRSGDQTRLVVKDQTEVEVCWIYCTSDTKCPKTTDSCFDWDSSPARRNWERMMRSELLRIVGYDIGDVRFMGVEAIACRGQRVAVYGEPLSVSTYWWFILGCKQQDSWVTVTMTTANMPFCYWACARSDWHHPLVCFHIEEKTEETLPVRRHGGKKTIYLHNLQTFCSGFNLFCPLPPLLYLKDNTASCVTAKWCISTCLSPGSRLVCVKPTARLKVCSQKQAGGTKLKTYSELSSVCFLHDTRGAVRMLYLTT